MYDFLRVNVKKQRKLVCKAEWDLNSRISLGRRWNCFRSAVQYFEFLLSKMEKVAKKKYNSPG